MSWLKFSFLFLLIPILGQAQSFNSKQCLDADFNFAIQNPGQLFGVLKNDLFFSKNGCEIEIRHQRLLTTVWKIDLCREPVHMKITSKGSQSVHKRIGECKDNETEYCSWKNELLTVIQDYGLIYAEGERDVLDSDHGKTYCTFLLLQKYLNQGLLFSKHRELVDIFSTATSSKPEVEQKHSLPTPTSEVETAPVPGETHGVSPEAQF